MTLLRTEISIYFICERLKELQQSKPPRSSYVEGKEALLKLSDENDAAKGIYVYIELLRNINKKSTKSFTVNPYCIEPLARTLEVSICMQYISEREKRCKLEFLMSQLTWVA
jgi:hypothetical protein